ncbi:UNVERIFIED_CONTAM: hypothetical protein PYX00_005265 [Menopon gallinae]|uniref:Uncharacterized protein n=1 Tax=Menopon gallinae TaxID=328185 RepID=A0AAW2HQI6_9NEOP
MTPHILFFTLFTSVIAGFSITPIVKELGLRQNKTFTFNKEVEYIVPVIGIPHDIAKQPVRIHIQCQNCDVINPAFITARQEQSVSSFELPISKQLANHQEVLYNETERTLCPYERLGEGKKKGKHLVLSLSTSNPKNVSVSLSVDYDKDFILRLNENKTFTITPSISRFFLYEFPSNNPQLSSVVLKVESKFNECMIMSIQNVSCPIEDTGLAYHKGYFQTVTQLGALTIKRDHFNNGFYAVFSMCADESTCSGPDLVGNERSKIVVLSLETSISSIDILKAVGITAGILLGFFIVMIIITHAIFMRASVHVVTLEEPIIEPSNTIDTCEPSTSCVPYEYNRSPIITHPDSNDTASIRTDSSLDETDVDILQPFTDKNLIRSKAALFVSDLARKTPLVLEKKSVLYFWNLMTVAIFYGLPAAQLVVTYQFDRNESGNVDICYYNFLCSHPLGYFNDFNHFISNIGYLWNGILFYIITKRKESVYRKMVSQNKNLEKNYGLPQHFGLFHAMATSLFIEGVLSACYHICPNIYNFQFDVSFMYVIGTLCMIKLYQSRHPDVNATAYSTFFVIAFVLFLSICGMFVNTPMFWFVFTTVHISTVLYLSTQIYYIGKLNFGIKACARYLKETRFTDLLFSKPIYPTRFCLIFMINICNLIIAICALLIGVKDVASYLLVIFIANLMLYTTFYIIMKIVSGEKILLQTILYIILSIICWCAALYYFFNKTISWKKPPSESRMYNKPCALFGFYDNHDIWHFLSSSGLFFSFLMLLTLDDDLIFTHRSKIPVF